MNIEAPIVDLVKESERMMVFTGAGMSQASGIKPFRSSGGIYGETPEHTFSKRFFFQKPHAFYDAFFGQLYHPDARPNEGHEILAKWEKEGRVIDIVTQNVDGLHQAAGNTMVTEFHGSIHTATCHNPKCQKTYETSALQSAWQQDKDFFMCDCGRKGSTHRYIKPDMVLFDEKGTFMSTEHLQRIRTRMWQADLILVMGTSLKVFPFRGFIDNKPIPIPMLIINQEPVSQQYKEHTHFIQADIAQTLQAIDALL